MADESKAQKSKRAKRAKRPKMTQQEFKDSVYKEVTESILARMEEGGLPPWRDTFKPANVNYDGPIVPHYLDTQRPYNGINFVTALVASMNRGFSTHAWATFNLVKKLGGSVNKDEKSIPIVFAGYRLVNSETGERINLSKMSKDDLEKLDRSVLVRRPVFDVFRVFNVDQCKGLEDKIGLDQEGTARLSVEAQSERNMAVILALKNHLLDSGLDIVEVPQIKAAHYKSGSHVVNIAPMAQYANAEEYAATLAHEAGHSTAAKLERDTSSYPREELVAELSAAMMMAKLNLPFNDTNTASYIESWRLRDAMKDDPKLLFDCAREAEKAASLICNDVLLANVAGIDAKFSAIEADPLAATNVNGPRIDETVAATEDVQVSAGSDADPMEVILSDVLSAAQSQQEAMLTEDGFDDLLSEVDEVDSVDAAIELAMSKLMDQKAPSIPVQVSENVPHAESESVSVESSVDHGESAGFDPANLIQIAADDIASLREIDVFRVLDQSMSMGADQANQSHDMANYICSHRPDLKGEVEDVMRNELGQMYTFKVKAAADKDLLDDPVIPLEKDQRLSDFLKF